MTGDAAHRQALLTEGDRVARELAQTLHVTLDGQERVILLGRSLAVNLIPAVQDTLEVVSRRAGQPLRAVATVDDRGRPALQVVDTAGVIRRVVPADDVIRDLLYVQGRLDQTVRAHLQDGLSGDEHHATRALVACLKSRAVLTALHRLVSTLLTA
ncbi:fermentation-respiration switch protein FrsA (DUF1100 family) [Deinococcus metalli]|uniref:Fermentation-respiration switch protein FrsA (DUF1100 family) n=1 Tax=Deinococcus metalli TaxID=1141878 RepID=A0A7W8NPH1_9DEIO|nr:hypothetical protein [Deinococcus metalli]MBB5374823.1 fermentation-respiration switch protein FrsA (DUF1100 family) [Deinococcus metalli]GHF33444.1 hypothetical protein GCM10017781_07750 [Deinococcus metalli]